MRVRPLASCLTVFAALGLAGCGNDTQVVGASSDGTDGQLPVTSSSSVAISPVAPSSSASSPSASSSVPETATIAGQYPKGGEKDGNGLALAAPKPGATPVDLYVDFQCPFCKAFELSAGDAMLADAKKGTIDLRVHLMTFLDRNLNNDSSAKAANAMFCAADAGKAGEFMHELFARQPKEGDGYAQADFDDAAAKAGISGTAQVTWGACVQSNKYGAYVKTTDAMSAIGANSTPTLKINGKKLGNDQMSTLMEKEGAWPQVLKDAKR